MIVLVVGYGSAGRRHAANARALGHDVVVSDKFDAKIAEAEAAGYRTSIPVCGVDAVVIASPASEHGFNLRQVVRYFDGAKVLIEKPLGLAASAFDGMPSDLTARTSVAYNWRFHPLVQGLRERVAADGVVWAPHHALFVMTCDRATWPGAGYGDTLSECSHEIDLALAMCGPAQLATAETEGGGWALRLVHDSGATSIVVLNDRDPDRSRGCRIGLGATIAGYDVDYTDPMEDDCVAASYVDELRAFLDGTVKPHALGLATFDDGLAVLRICAAARLAVAPAATRA